MKNNINIISSDIVNKIAAGEVIERPASIVKELIENSIDAGSTEIHISIEKGGIESIVVKDNGCGIESKEIKLAFTKHATSKISKISDLDAIATLGFRGEALTSIAHVSHATICTATNKGEAYETSIKEGKIGKVKLTARPQGTTIIVKKLFDNFPARKKFIKTPESEQIAITRTMKNFFLSYPEIGFTYSNKNKKIYQLRANTLKGRILDIFGSSYEDSLIHLLNRRKGYSIDGYIGNLDLIKKRTGEQFLFVNNRHVNSKMINHTIYRSYSSLIQRGEYPFFVLNINLSPSLYDINVHPSKKEIRFKEEWRVNQFIKDTIKKSLSNSLDVIPSYTFAENQKKIDLSEELDFPEKQLSYVNTDSLLTKNSIDNQIEDILNQKNEERFEINDIWQIENKYLLTKLNDGIVIIDQHVAHERILYDSAIKGLQSMEVESQTALFPKSLHLPNDDYQILIELLPYINKIGFKLREFGENTIIIEGVPVYMKNDDEISIINDIISSYETYGKDELEIQDKIAANYACKAAVKAGDSLKENEMKHLVNKLFQSDNPYFCPHGRPIIVSLTTDELDVRFERK